MGRRPRFSERTDSEEQFNDLHNDLCVQDQVQVQVQDSASSALTAEQEVFVVE